MNGVQILPDCEDTSGECFARRYGKCFILRKGQIPHQCTFKKEKRLVTNGVKYPDKHPTQRVEV